MKRILAVLVILVVLAGMLGGCGSQTAKVNTSTPIPSVTYPLKVKDDGGFEMTLEQQPQNIVSLTLGTDEMLLSLVNSSRIKSLTKYADDTGLSNVTEAAKVIKVRASMDSVESIIALQPDLVFVDTWAAADFVKQLRDAKINVFVFKTPSNISDQRTVVKEIAHVVGEDAKGADIVAWMDQKLSEVDGKLKALKPEDKLTILSYDELGCTSGIGTNYDDIVTRAGLINAASKAGLKGWPKLSKEKVVEMNPDILDVPGWYYDKNNTVDSFTKKFTDDKGYATVKAVMNNRLIILPSKHMSAISQYVVLAVEDVAKAAYPELFK